METKIIQIGNSLGIIIPKSFLKKKALQQGDIVSLEDSIGEGVFIVAKKGVLPPTSSITLEFYNWVKEFNEKHKDVLPELARR